jgi:hypothetical protein
MIPEPACVVGLQHNRAGGKMADTQADMVQFLLESAKRIRALAALCHGEEAAVAGTAGRGAADGT